MPFSCFVSLADFVFVSIFRFLFGQDWPIDCSGFNVSERDDVIYFVPSIFLYLVLWVVGDGIC